LVLELYHKKWLFVVYCFTSCSRIFHLYGDVTITGDRLQNLGLCSALWAFEQAGIFIVPHLLRHGTSVSPVSSEGPPHSVASYDTQGDVKNLFLPGFSRVPYQSPLTTHKGMWRIYSNPDPHGNIKPIYRRINSFVYVERIVRVHWPYQGILQ
jgi:hypothetical protein